LILTKIKDFAISKFANPFKPHTYTHTHKYIYIYIYIYIYLVLARIPQHKVM